MIVVWYRSEERVCATKVVGDAFIDLHVKVKLRPDRDDRVHLSFLVYSHILSSFLQQSLKYDCQKP
jgi:hypothetical protein